MPFRIAPDLQEVGVSVFKSIKGTYRELGGVSGSVYLLDQLLKRLLPDSGIYFYDWMVQPVADARLVPEKRVAKYSFKVIDQDEPVLHEMPILPEILQSRLEQKAECVALFKGGELVGYIWFTFGAYIEDEVRINFLLEPKEASVFDFNLYIFPKYRLGYAFSAIWDYANRYLYERGIRYSYSRITHLKQNSFSSHSKLGAQKIGASITLKLAKFELTIVRKPFRVHVSISDSKRLDVSMRYPS